MLYTWTTLLLVSCALVQADGEVGAEALAPLATTRPPPRTLDRKAAELAWKSWLQSPESGNQNAPPRRITTKSLFITPLVCPKGQRLDRNGCIQVVTVNKDEHERIFLEELNALFTTPPSGGLVSTDVIYDYGEDEPGPLQLSIPIGLDPQAAPLQGQGPSAEAPGLNPNNIKVDKKDGNKPDGDVSIEAELELLKLQNTLNPNNTELESSNILNQNVLTNIHNYPEKPKRDSPSINISQIEAMNDTVEVGQKELVYGQVNIDPISYNLKNRTEDTIEENNKSSAGAESFSSALNVPETKKENISIPVISSPTSDNTKPNNSFPQLLRKDEDQSKLNPENDYSDIGEAIKLISRYADVTTDDNFTKEHKYRSKDDSVLGTRTKQQHRRNKPKEQQKESVPMQESFDLENNAKIPSRDSYQSGVYYRYPWASEHSATPPPNYPFHHLQDYWPDRNQIGGVYNTHENPRRHHHSYPHNFRLHGYPHSGFGVIPAYPEQLKGYIHRVVQHHANSMRPHSNNQNLYSLLGLRHWFSGEGASKR